MIKENGLVMEGARDLNKVEIEKETAYTYDGHFDKDGHLNLIKTYHADEMLNCTTVENIKIRKEIKIKIVL